MRFIDLDRLIPEIRDLIPALEEAHEEVVAERDPARRRELIERYRPRWVALRSAMDRYSYGKCWYLECKNPGTDDDVDHFRPKGAVAEDASHPGYYWLAFQWRNLRLSCHRANRLRRNEETDVVGGKGDHFPLLDGSIRATGPGENLSLELPALLDPTKSVDVAMLSFKPNGEVDLTPTHKGNPQAETRLELSRRYLHLDWKKIREGRILAYNMVERLVDRGARAAPQNFADTANVAGEFLSAIQELVALMKPDEEYSAAIRVYVKSFKHVWWVEQIVLEVAA